jgi:thiol-disulfide isomerase/thioredoxin
MLPPIRLADLKGTPRSLEEWQGRTLLINFWATWCAPCRKEMPLLEALQQSADPAELQVIGIAIDRQEPVLRFVGEAGVTYPILAGEGDATQAAEQFGDAFRALPFSVVAAPDGTVLAAHTGELDRDALTLIATVAGQLARGGLSTGAARDLLQRGLARPSNAGSSWSLIGSSPSISTARLPLVPTISLGWPCNTRST